MTTQDMVTGLLAAAAEAAHEVRNAIETNKQNLTKAGNVRSLASDAVTKLNREADGFMAPRFAGLVKVAAAFGPAFNDPESADAREVASKMAVTYLATMTGSTEKTIEGGGRKNGAAAVIRLGANASTVVNALDARVRHWQERFDSAIEGESAEDKRDRQAKARRYTQPAKKDGDSPKHKGRPPVTVRGINLGSGADGMSYGGGTNRDAMVAAAATLYAVHGNDFLQADVLDAFLDNGGPPDKKDDTLADRARAAGHLVAALLAEAADSPDKMALEAATNFLDLLAQRGTFTASRAAAAQASPLPASSVVDKTPDADEVLSGATPPPPPPGSAPAKPARPAKPNKPGLAI